MSCRLQGGWGTVGPQGGGACCLGEGKGEGAAYLRTYSYCSYIACTYECMYDCLYAVLVCQYVHMLFDFRFAFYVCDVLLLWVHEYKCCLSVPPLPGPNDRPPSSSFYVCACVCISLFFVCARMCFLIVVCTCLLSDVVAVAVVWLTCSHELFALASALSRLLINAVRRVVLLYLYVHKQIYKSHRHAPPRLLHGL